MRSACTGFRDTRATKSFRPRQRFDRCTGAIEGKDIECVVELKEPSAPSSTCSNRRKTSEFDHSPTPALTLTQYPEKGVLSGGVYTGSKV